MSQAPRKGKKYFTVDEANRAVPYVARIVEEIARCYRDAVAIHQQLDHPTDDKSQSRQRQSQYESAMDRLNELIEELRHVGVELKDFEKGLIDFPAVHDGREIYLCWHSGEPTVTAWHETDAGFAGRRDISLLSITKQQL